MAKAPEKPTDVDLLVAAGRTLYWPRIMFSADIASAFRSSDSSARRGLAAGKFGPAFKVGRRWAVLKEDLLDHLRSQSRQRPPLRVVPAERGRP